MAKVTTKKVSGVVKAVGKTSQGNYLITVIPKDGGKEVAIEVPLDPIALALNLQVVYSVGDKVKYSISNAPAKPLAFGIEKVK